MQRRIPYAVANYEKLVRENFYFVDKTAFIRDLEQYKVPVFLRPRRFGKSLWCSILECYYDVRRAERFEELFGKTAIGREPTAAHNSQMVMRFDFSVVKMETEVGELERSFDRACHDALRIFVRNYAEYARFPTMETVASATDRLRAILGAVQEAGAPPLHIIIDEYDNFTNQLITTRQDELYREVTTGDSFLRTFFKVIKAGVGDGSVARVFITGVLPITIDDLTSGFNIAQIITLEEPTLNMMGFTQTEVDTYVGEIFKENGWSDELRRRVLEDLRAHYNGYRLLPDATETLYNSTICNFYLSKLVIGKGKIPREMIDDNLRVDVNWLRRLAGSREGARELVEQLMFEGTLPADMDMLSSKFNMERFFQREFFPLSLYYLGMVTFRDRFSLVFPNLSVKKIYAEYFNELENITVSLGYQTMFERFLKDHDWAALFAGYWKTYVGQIPAQAFDKVNENFFRTTFYELCTRYLLPDFHFAIEVNSHAGRSDWQAVGRGGTQFEGHACVIEFKHYPRATGKRAAGERATSKRTADERADILSLERPLQEDAAQVERYAVALQRAHPELTIRRYVAYTVGAQGGRLVEVP